MSLELKQSIRIVLHQIKNIKKEIEINFLKMNQIEILGLKSLITTMKNALDSQKI